VKFSTTLFKKTSAGFAKMANHISNEKVAFNL